MILSIFGPAPRIISTGEHVYVEYINNHSHLSFRASHDYGVTFDAPIDLGPLGGVIDGTPYDGQMALSGSNVYLTWIRVDDVGGGKVDGHFYFRASHDNGVTFDPLMSLITFDDMTSLCCLQKIAAYANQVYVVMSGNLLRSSNDNGVTFGPIIDLGSTAMHYAAQGGRNRIVEFLAANGANLDVKNKAGKTPLDLAMVPGPTGRYMEIDGIAQTATAALIRKLMAK